MHGWCQASPASQKGKQQRQRTMIEHTIHDERTNKRTMNKQKMKDDKADVMTTMTNMTLMTTTTNKMTKTTMTMIIKLQFYEQHQR